MYTHTHTHTYAHTYPNIHDNADKKLLYLFIEECGCVDGQLWWYEHLDAVTNENRT